MLFSGNPSRPYLRVVLLKREDSRTYLTARIDGLVDRIGSRYRVVRQESGTYQNVKFDQCCVFEHEDGFFKVIDWGDRDHPDKMECAEIIGHPKCQFVLKCQYNLRWHIPKLRPYFYFEKTDPVGFSVALDHLRGLPKTTQLYWRGNRHLGRGEILDGLADLLNPDYRELAPRPQYYRELAQSKLTVSLPGLARLCHRDFEAFGVGTVVVAPPLQNTCHVPLVQDKHYLCVAETTHQAIRSKVESTPANELEMIRENAMTYYDQYIRYEASLTWLEHLLEL